jgi:hypothetical protein
MRKLSLYYNQAVNIKPECTAIEMDLEMGFPLPFQRRDFLAQL